MRYATITDVIEHAVVPALGEFADDFDVEAIAREAFVYHVDHDEQGRELLDTAGFVQDVYDEEFWRIVAKHDQSQ